MLLVHVFFVCSTVTDGVSNTKGSPVLIRLNVIYTCTENIENNGQIIAYSVHPDGGLTKIGQIDAGGTSTCYLTIDREQNHILSVNYWDSTLAAFPISQETGSFTGEMRSIYDPKGGQAMMAAAKKDGEIVLYSLFVQIFLYSIISTISMDVCLYLFP